MSDSNTVSSRRTQKPRKPRTYPPAVQALRDEIAAEASTPGHLEILPLPPSAPEPTPATPDPDTALVEALRNSLTDPPLVPPCPVATPSASAPGSAPEPTRTKRGPKPLPEGARKIVLDAATVTRIEQWMDTKAAQVGFRPSFDQALAGILDQGLRGCK